jgi:hypothetical protein
MNPHGNSKPEQNDSDQLMRLVELELAQRRVALQQARSPYRGFRLASFVFLFAVLLGALLAFYYVFYSGGLEEMRARKSARPTVTPSAQAP